ncbi:MAG: hypothetical protein Q7J29_13200 [Stagnimonas sp.]|nr:hypothetical protein [Stagnimonas sp.]
MKPFSFTTSASALALGFAALGLAACNDQNTSTTPVLTIPTTPTTPVAMTTVSGVAATGAPISGGAVALRCANGTTASTTSAADGRWSASVPSSALPCAVQVSGGTPTGTFYSIARSASGTASTANLTPIGDLALASAVNAAVGTAVDAWYASATDAQRQQVADGLNTAIASLRTALANAGYSLPGEGFDPFTAAITAGAATDAYDQLLEAYKQALADEGKTYESARGDYTAGAGVAAAPTTTPPPTGETPDTSLSASETGARFATTGTVLGTAEQNQLRYWAGPGSVTTGSTAGTLDEVTLIGPDANSYLNFRDLPDAVGTYDCGYGFNDEKANIELGFAANNGYNTVGTRGSNGTFTTGFRCSITLTKVGERNGSGYTGAIEGSFDAQLYRSGRAVNQPDSISVKGNFRLGAATPVTPTPTPTVGKGILGSALNTVFAGDYVLKCSASPGQAVQTFAFSIAADGSSRFNGAPLVDATHPGVVETEGILSSGITMEFSPSASGSAYVVLGFRSDGSFVPNSVHVPGEPYGQTLTCFSNSGNTAPAGTSRALQSIPQAVAALARTETLNCRQGGATAPQTLTINSDGSAQLGAQSFAAATLFNITDRLLFGAEGQKGTVQYSDSSSGSFRLLAVDVDADLKTTGVIAAVGTGPNDSISCTP